MPHWKNPHLPEGPVRLCAVSAAQPYIIRALRERGLAVIPVKAHPGLPVPAASHADMLLHPLGAGLVMAARGQAEPAGLLKQYGFTVWEARRELRAEYPGDCGLNCFSLGSVLFCKPEAVDPALLDCYRRSGFQTELVRQGYAKCSVLPVGENAAVTADPGMAAALEKRGVEVLRIRPGHISLPGYGTGFIGGCGGFLGKRLLAFAGDISTHPDGPALRAFCRRHGVDVLSLSAAPLTDVGGILPLQVPQR